MDTTEGSKHIDETIVDLSLKTNGTLCTDDKVYLELWFTGTPSFEVNIETPNGEIITYNDINSSPLLIEANTPGGYQITNFNDSEKTAKLSCGQTSASVKQTGTAPTIISQPQDITTCYGTEANFNVSTDFPNPTYKWEFSTDNGQSWKIANNIFTGQTTSTLTQPTAEVDLLVRVKVYSDDCFTLSDVAKLSVDCLTNLNSQETEINTFPNPVTDKVNINFNAETIEIINTTGQTLYATTNSNNVDVSSLPHGVYILKALKDNNWVTTRFVKK